MCVCVCMPGWINCLFIMRRCQTSDLTHHVLLFFVAVFFFLHYSVDLAVNYSTLIHFVHKTVSLCVYMCV